MRNVLIDAGPLIALFAADNSHHARYDNFVTCESGLREIMTVDVNDFARYRLPDGETLVVL